MSEFLNCPITNYQVIVDARAVPRGFESIVEFCKKEYNYEYFGRSTRLRTQMSGEFFNLYFKDATTGEFHCLPHSEVGSNVLEKERCGKKPLFAW